MDEEKKQAFLKAIKDAEVDEAKAVAMYVNLAIEAQQLGDLRAWSILNNIAADEHLHYSELQSILKMLG